MSSNQLLYPWDQQFPEAVFVTSQGRSLLLVPVRNFSAVLFFGSSRRRQAPAKERCLCRCSGHPRARSTVKERS